MRRLSFSQCVQDAELWERLARHHWTNYRQRWNDRPARRYYAERMRCAIARIRWNRQRIAQFAQPT